MDMRGFTLVYIYIQCAKAQPPPPRCSYGAFVAFRLWSIVTGQPGCFEDSFALNFGLPGSAGSVPTVLHDATDAGKDYSAFVAGVKGAKMIPRNFKTQEK